MLHWQTQHLPINQLLSEEEVDLHFFSANLLKQIGGAYYTMGEEKGKGEGKTINR